MSKSNSGHFWGTLGTSSSGIFQQEETYATRGIDVSPEIKDALVKLKNKGDYIVGTNEEFSEINVSIMARETGVEFARITIGNKTYLIRGDSKETTIPYHILLRMTKSKGTLDFHCHPHKDDVIPSIGDMRLMDQLKQCTGQNTSRIVATNGKTSIFNNMGIISTSTVHYRIDNKLKSEYIKLFGGK